MHAIQLCFDAVELNELRATEIIRSPPQFVESQGGIEALPATDLWRTVSTHSDPPAYYIHENYYCTFVPADCSNCVGYKVEKILCLV